MHHHGAPRPDRVPLQDRVRDGAVGVDGLLHEPAVGHVGKGHHRRIDGGQQCLHYPVLAAPGDAGGQTDILRISILGLQDGSEGCSRCWFQGNGWGK